jgi:hypothetical protein
MIVSASAKVESVMSSLIPPRVATALYSGGTTQAPSRLAPPKMASDMLNRGVPPIRPRAGVLGSMAADPGPRVAGRSRVTGTRSASVLAE